MRILIIKMWAIGDILMATPMLNAIRAKEPDAHISWLVDVVHADVLANHPLIDEVIPLDSGSWRRLRRRGNLIGWTRRTRELARAMQERHFDCVINCQAQEWWSYFLCQAPARVGLFSWPKMPWWSRLYTHALPKPRLAGLHNTHHFLQASAAIGFPPAGKKMSVGETPEERRYADDFWGAHGFRKEQLTVALAPFSTARNRSISLDQTVEIANWLAKEYDAQMILTCGPKDCQEACQIAGKMQRGRIAIAQGTSLREYIGLLRRSDLVICADSSAMHLAGALGVPFVALFGPTPLKERAPLEGVGEALAKPLPCAPCDLPTCRNKVFQQCMRLIELRDLQQAVRRVLGSSTGSFIGPVEKTDEIPETPVAGG